LAQKFRIFHGNGIYNGGFSVVATATMGNKKAALKICDDEHKEALLRDREMLNVMRGRERGKEGGR
jgi:hypothetical protein